jgi:hypothetical protein
MDTPIAPRIPGARAKLASTSGTTIKLSCTVRGPTATHRCAPPLEVPRVVVVNRTNDETNAVTVEFVVPGFPNEWMSQYTSTPMPAALPFTAMKLAGAPASVR